MVNNLQFKVEKSIKMTHYALSVFYGGCAGALIFSATLCKSWASYTNFPSKSCYFHEFTDFFSIYHQLNFTCVISSISRCLHSFSFIHYMLKNTISIITVIVNNFIVSKNTTVNFCVHKEPFRYARKTLLPRICYQFFQFQYRQKAWISMSR